MNKIKQIDSLIESLYTKKKYSELDALAILFSKSFLKKLEIILNGDTINKSVYSNKYIVKSGWIDKIPVAEFINITYDIHSNHIKSRVELGDMLLVYEKSYKSKKNVPSNKKPLTNRAALIQAKLCDVENPLTPIGKMDKNRVTSTSKELALLSNWPEFHLYKSGNSKDTILQNIKLDANKPNRYFAGYFDKKWHIGEPIFNHQCKRTFGDLIMSLIENNSGEEFIQNDHSSNWNRLVNNVIKICNNSYLPFSIFNRRNKRLVSSNYLLSVIAFFFFFFPFGIARFHTLIIHHRIEE